MVGLSFDFVVYNLLGFTCYSIYMVSTASALRVACARLCESSCQPAQSHNTNNNTLMMFLKTRSQCAEFWSKRVREEYREANDGDEVSVQINDVGKRSSPGLLHQCIESCCWTHTHLSSPVFALHGVAMVLLTMFQCLIYEVCTSVAL